MSTDSWALVYSTKQPWRAELLKAYLAEAEIGAFIMNKQDSAYISIGEIEVWVKKDQVVRALHTIKKYEQEEPDTEG